MTNIQSNLDSRVFKTLEGLEASKITVVEWETPLLGRLGYPLAAKPDFIFLIPDEELPKATEIAAASGLQVSDVDAHPLSYLSEFSGQAFRSVYGDPKQRLILHPLSWTGIEKHELETAQTTEYYASPLPCTLHTMPLSVFCAAYLHIIVQESAGSRVRVMAIADLSNVIAYSMFDMSYEGSCMLGPEDHLDDEVIETTKAGDNSMTNKEKDELEMKNALEKIGGWHFKNGDEWVKDVLTKLVSGRLRYEDLPSRKATNNNQTVRLEH